MSSTDGYGEEPEWVVITDPAVYKALKIIDSYHAVGRAGTPLTLRVASATTGSPIRRAPPLSIPPYCRAGSSAADHTPRTPPRALVQ